MGTESRLYSVATGFGIAPYSARPTTTDKAGMVCTVHNEQYKRDYPEARTPDIWGLKHYKTGKLTRVKATRMAARTARKPTERVVAIWL